MFTWCPAHAGIQNQCFLSTVITNQRDFKACINHKYFFLYDASTTGEWAYIDNLLVPFYQKQGVQEIAFFHNSLQPLPRLHCCKRPLKLSTQCECTVTPIGWQFFVQPIAAECWRGKSGKLSRILGKDTIFNEHPVSAIYMAGNYICT